MPKHSRQKVLLFPKLPILRGYIFSCWTVNNAVAALVADKVTPIEIKVVYEKNEIPHTVTVPTGAFTDGSTEKSFYVSDIVTLIANKQSAEQQFAYWERDGKIVSMVLF